MKTSRPITFGTKLVSVTGRFGLENNGDNGLFFQMSFAEVR